MNDGEKRLGSNTTVTSTVANGWLSGSWEFLKKKTTTTGKTGGTTWVVRGI